jgi:hypothetical protein
MKSELHNPIISKKLDLDHYYLVCQTFDMWVLGLQTRRESIEFWLVGLGFGCEVEGNRGRSQGKIIFWLDILILSKRRKDLTEAKAETDKWVVTLSGRGNV